MEKRVVKRRCMLLVLLLMMPLVTIWAQTLVNGYVTVDGIEYRIDSKNGATAYRLTSDFTGTSVVLADSVQAVWKNDQNPNDTLMVPVLNVYDSFLSYNETVTSLTLPKTFVGVKKSFYYEGGDTHEHDALNPGYAKALKEVIVAEGNQNFKSVDGLLCNATGDTLLYIPCQYLMEKEEWSVPEGIRSIPLDAYIYRNSLSDFGVKKMIFTSDIDYAYLCANDVTLHNVTPPTLISVDYYTTLYVPVGSAPAYYEKYKEKNVFAVLEENTNVKSIRQNAFSGAQTVYDIDGDGEMECVGYTNNYYAPYGDVIRNPQRNSFLFMKNGECIHRDSIADEIGQYENLNIGTLRIEQTPYNDKLQYVIDDRIIQQTAENLCASIFNEDYSLYVDVDNDGLKDIVSKYSSSEGLNIYSQQLDGSFVKSNQYLTEKAEEIEKGGSGSIVSFLQGFLRNGMFVDDSPSPLQNITKAVDFNNDGILDFVDDVAGGVMYSYGDGKYYTSKSMEVIYPVDIDNDGVLDYVLFDGQTVCLMDNVTSPSSEKKELFKNSKIDKMFFKDFDHDGDIDILVFINDKTTVSGNYKYVSYFVFLRNNGDGTFRKKESNMADTQYTLVDCRDYDADGKYELLVVDTSWDGSNYKNDCLLLKVGNDFSVSAIPETFGIQQSKNYKYGKNLMLGDFDNDGFTEFYSNNGDIYGVLKSQTAKNSAPQKMPKPTALLDTESYRLKIAWAQGEDNETSACDLTYALRIGTAPGLSDVLCPASLPDGTRKTVREGEMGTALFTLFNAASLTPGKYYIAVQAIDGGGLGGQFSDELVYEHQMLDPKFYVSTNQLSTADTLEVYVKNTVLGATYEWTISEGEMIDRKDNGAKIVFHQAGSHQISLTTIYEGNSYKSAEQTIDVGAAKINDTSTLDWPFDFNQDGFVDGFRASQLSGNVYGHIDAIKNLGDGTYSDIQLSTFSDLNGYINFVTDFNHDGYPDFIISNCSKGNVFLNYGEQDDDFDYQTKDVNLPYETYSKGGIDLNNDGWPDYIEYGLCYSQENLKDYTLTSYENLIGASGRYLSDFTIHPQLFDVNRDGFLDIVWAPSNEADQETIVLCCLKDKTTECSYSEPKVLFRLPYELREFTTQIDNPDPEKYQSVYVGNSYGSNILADFNNDGYLDLGLVINKSVTRKLNNGEMETDTERAFYIFKGKPEGESSEVALKIDNIILTNSSWVAHACDMNNDGYVDIPYVEKDM